MMSSPPAALSRLWTRLAEQTQCTIVGQAAVLAEGDAAQRKDIIFLEPLFFH